MAQKDLICESYQNQFHRYVVNFDATKMSWLQYDKTKWNDEFYKDIIVIWPLAIIFFSLCRSGPILMYIYEMMVLMNTYNYKLITNKCVGWNISHFIFFIYVVYNLIVLTMWHKLNKPSSQRNPIDCDVIWAFSNPLLSGFASYQLETSMYFWHFTGLLILSFCEIWH